MGMDIEIILVSRQVWYLFFFFQKGRGVNSILLLLENLQKDIFLSDLRYGIGQVRFQFKALQYILECLTIIKIAFKLQIC